MSLEQEAVILLSLEKEKTKEGYARDVLADLVEKKKKERESCLEEIRQEWITQLTKDYVEDKVSGAITRGRSRVVLIEIPEDIYTEYNNKELDDLLLKVDVHIRNMYQFKGMRLTYIFEPHSIYNYQNLFIVWDQPSCLCNLQ